MSKRVRLVVTFVACLLTAPLLVLVLTPWGEPYYSGHSLSYWLAMEVKLEREWAGYGALHPANDKHEQVQAVRHIGTNALPCLLSWIAYEPSLLKIKWRDFRRSASGRIFDRWLSDSGSMPSPPDPPELALSGFKILGEQARSAVPSLVRMANEPGAKELAACAATHALGCIGTRALPELLSVLTNRSARVRLQAVFVLREFGTNALPAVPALLDCFRDTDEDVAVTAMSAIHHAYLKESDVLAALVNSLQDTRGKVRISALGRLSETGPTAVPILEHALEDSDFTVRFYAVNLLLQGNPMVLTN